MEHSETIGHIFRILHSRKQKSDVVYPNQQDPDSKWKLNFPISIRLEVNVTSQEVAVKSSISVWQVMGSKKPIASHPGQRYGTGENNNKIQ